MKRATSQHHAHNSVRRVCAVLGLVSVILTACWPATGQQGGRTVRLEPVSELPSSAKRFAIIIGVDAYEDQQINGLYGAGNDASALASALVEYGGFPKDQVFLLTGTSGERPTRPNIFRRLANLKGVVPKDGLLLVAFSGHGIDRGGRGYLLPADAQSLGNVALLEETAVSVDRVREFILETGVGQVLFIIDACRNDPLAGKGDSDNAMSAAFSRGFSFDVANREVQAFATLYATEVGHRAFENRARGRGYFSEALVEGLSGKAANARGEVTLGALVTYLETTVPRRIALDHGVGTKQRPSARIELYRATELIVSKVAPLAVPVTIDPKAVELDFWNAIKDSKDAADFEAYLREYPSGSFASLARLNVGKLRPPVKEEPRQPPPAGDIASVPPLKSAQPDPVPSAPSGDASTAPAPRPAAQGGARSFDLDNGASVEMVLVEAGTFTMGSTNGGADERPMHRVTISNPYYLGKYEVTQEQWAAVMGTIPSKFKGANFPVENVSWNEVQEFLRALNAKTGGGWRLPTEAEWEYACRAGTTGDYAGNLDDTAWYSANSGKTTHPVGRRRPNGWGLYDMHGNVWEWCQDWYGAYTRDDQTDPAGASGGSYRGSRSGNWSGNAAEDAIDPYVTGLAENRVYRGGSWYNDAANCRSAKRYGTLATNRIVNLGFRLARSVAGTEEPAPDGEARLHGDAPAADFVESGRASLARKARVLNSPRPAYTERARREGTQGNVVVKVVLGANGRVLSASLVKGLPNGLNEKAVEAAYRLRFEPATDENGRPIDSTITVSVNFTIGDRK